MRFGMLGYRLSQLRRQGDMTLGFNFVGLMIGIMMTNRIRSLKKKKQSGTPSQEFRKNAR